MAGLECIAPFEGHVPNSLTRGIAEVAEIIDVANSRLVGSRPLNRPWFCRWHGHRRRARKLCAARDGGHTLLSRPGHASWGGGIAKDEEGKRPVSIHTRTWSSALSLTDSFVPWLLAAGALAIFLGLLGWLARGASVNAALERSTTPTTGQRTLLVMVYGMGGYRRFQSAVRLAMQAIPLADVLCLRYRCSWITNLSPYTARAADVL
jgi:hypothetical protein